MLIQLVYILLIVTLLLGLKRLSWGAAAMLAIRTVVPPVARIGGVSLNTAIIAVMTILCLYDMFGQKNGQMQWREIKNRCGFPIYRLMIPLLLLGTIGAVVPFGYQFKSWLQFIITELLPFYIILVSIKDSKDFKIITGTFAISYIVIGIYGLMTYVWKMNPLFMLFALQFDFDPDAIYTGDGSDKLRGGMTSSASGNLSGPLPWGQCSLVSLFIAMYLPVVKKKWIRYLLIAIAALNCFFCSKRSVILPMILMLGYYVWSNKLLSLKRVMASLVILLMSLGAISQLESTSGLWANVSSSIMFWDDIYAEQNDIGGSSKEMRASQLEEAVRMIAPAPIQGLGYEFPSYYGSKNGSHPIMHGFESIIFRVLVSSGIVGLLLWFLFFRKTIAFTRDYENRKMVTAIHLLYILSLLLTGNQASFYIYMIMVGLMYRYKQLSDFKIQ